MASTVAAEGCRDSSNCSLVIASQRPRAPLPDRGGHRMERGGEIDGNDHVQVFERKSLDRRDMLNPDVVDENINRAELRLGFLHHGADFVRPR
jgi:hypothetical protein